MLMSHLIVCAATLFAAQQHSAPAALVKTVPTLTLDGARAVIDAAEALAHQRGVGGAIAVVDAGGELVAFERLSGTFPAGAEVSMGKARTAALFKKPTRVFEEIVNKGRTAMVAIDGFTPLIGGIPLVVEGQVIGAVGVSGASSAQEDEELALAGAAALANAPVKVGASTSVRHLPSVAVADAFARGATLFATDGLIVNASRRDVPGEAEVHVDHLDVFYIVSGAATLTTGGTLVAGRELTGPDQHGHELRGASIEGGASRSVAKGDVIVIPAGTPHWFNTVGEPLVYFVVKSS